MLRLAVFASGGGSNLQSLIDHFNTRESRTAVVSLVVSDRDDAGVLARATRAGITNCVIAVSGRAPETVAAETLAALQQQRIDIIALAGYLKLVPQRVVEGYRRRIVNIHPALLPAFGGKGMYGMRVHRAVLESGASVTGVTVHYVDERYDEGKAIVQWPVPVIRGETAEALAARVLRVEHAVYPLAIELVARSLESDLTSLDAGFVVKDDSQFILAQPASEQLGVAVRTALFTQESERAAEQTARKGEL